MSILFTLVLIIFFYTTYLDAKSSVGFEGNSFWGKNKLWVNPNGTLNKLNYWIISIIAASVSIVMFILVKDKNFKFVAIGWLIIGTITHTWAYIHNKRMPTLDYEIYKEHWILIFITTSGYTSETIINRKTFVFQGYNTREEALNVARNKIDEN